jgi:hypothetical protein
MKKISWANQVENEEILHRVRVKGTSYNHTHINKGRLTKLSILCIGHTLLKQAEGKHIHGKIKGIGR